MCACREGGGHSVYMWGGRGTVCACGEGGGQCVRVGREGVPVSM